jgi:hypothetical protein
VRRRPSRRCSSRCPKFRRHRNSAGDPDLEPQVTIKRKEGETVEEARVNGHLIWIKVTPRHGKSYYLIPDCRRREVPSGAITSITAQGSDVAALRVLN